MLPFSMSLPKKQRLWILNSDYSLKHATKLSKTVCKKIQVFRMKINKTCLDSWNLTRKDLGYKHIRILWNLHSRLHRIHAPRCWDSPPVLRYRNGYGNACKSRVLLFRPQRSQLDSWYWMFNESRCTPSGMPELEGGRERVCARWRVKCDNKSRLAHHFE